MVRKTNVIQLEVENDFDRFDETSFPAPQTIDVTPEDVRVKTTAHQPPPAQEKQCYAHHSYYGEGYKSPDLPQTASPYSSTKAKSWMMMFSLALWALTANFMQITQNKIAQVSQERSSNAATDYRYHNEKVAETMDMMLLNTQALSESMNKMGQIVKNRKALVQVETALRQQNVGKGKAFSDEQARDLLLRAGYQPSQINDKKIASFRKNYQGVDGDVDFVRDVASDIVQDEVESFVYKMKLISSVGEYIYSRTKD